jgi:hypothetical protein
MITYQSRNCLVAVAAILFYGLLSALATGSARAATADVTSFNARHHEVGPMIYHDDLSYTYQASWSTSGLQCDRSIDWYSGGMQSAQMSYTTHTTSPVNVSGSETCVVHYEGTGNYYKILVVVEKFNPYENFAEDAMTDGTLSS